MSVLTPEAREIASTIAARLGLSADAVETMLIAVANGNGTQAQFNHPELGGMGQWSYGGMTMVGDMFNNGLKATVDALCTELSGVVAKQRVFAVRTGAWSHSSAQSQSQGHGGTSFSMSGRAASWPEELGHPASTGAQNDMRYGVFPESRRLAVEMGGRMAVYDTGDHRITGVSQQQGGDRSLTFTSQHGLVRASDLRRIEIEADEDAPAPTGDVADIPKAMADVLPGVPGPINPVDTPSLEPRKKPAPDAKTPPKAATGGDDIIALIEKLADLKANGILTEAEFEAKKTELLSRL